MVCGLVRGRTVVVRVVVRCRVGPLVRSCGVVVRGVGVGRLVRGPLDGVGGPWVLAVRYLVRWGALVRARRTSSLGRSALVVRPRVVRRTR
ncbi:hypothetical protein DN402_08865 [Streptomyces sp. SW4]|nr:hypothetical protein DN402_08865 [Streptomyces sp. SW4]